MDQIDLIHCAGQLLLPNPQDVSEWILRGRPIQLFPFTSTHETLRQRAMEQTRGNRESEKEILQPLLLKFLLKLKRTFMLLVLLCFMSVFL